MSVDVFGRQLIREKEVHRGPRGIGFSVTTSGDFDIENKLLCNVAEAKSDLDAVNLKHVKQLMIEFGKELKKDIKNSLIDEIKTSLKAELETDITENTANIEYIECMIANGSDKCEKKVYSR